MPGGRGLRGVFAQPRRLIDPRFARMLWQVKRFHLRASAFLRTTDNDNLMTYGEFLEREGFNGYFIAHYAVPVVSCVWSAGRETTLLYPARYLFRFLDHHGMLRVAGSPRWSTVAGGSRTYVERLAGLLEDVRAAHAVTDVTRREDGVEIRDVTGQVTRRDRVVIATHADQALALLTDPSDAEVSTLKQFGYSRNVTLLHTDSSVLPDAAQARACWNYRMTSCDRPDQPAVVTYWMNRLQGHRAAEDFLVTLNDRERPDPGSVVATMEYDHPIYTPESVRAQSRLGGLATDRTVYAGAYHGWGFHEDGCRSGVGGGPAFRGDLVSAASAATAAAACAQLPAAPGPGRRPGHAPAPRTGPARLRAPGLPVAGRPRLGSPASPGTSGLSRTSAARTTSATARLPIKANIENYLALNRIRPR